MAAAYVFLQGNPRRERVFRDRFDPLDGMSDKELISRYRLSRNCILDVLEAISQDLQKPTNRCRAILPIVQLTTALRFYANGNFQREVADLHGLSHPSVSRCVLAVSEALARRVKDYIKCPTEANEIRQVKNGFFIMTGFPNVIGAIDGTLVPIKAPSSDEPLFVSRKGFHAIVTKWPGSTHDAYVLGMSELYVQLDVRQPPGWLLGDSGYPLKHWLLTPVLNPGSRAEQQYNVLHCRIRNAVERFNGVWKSRFRCLDRSGGTLQYKPQRCVSIITATACLHQVCVVNRLPAPELATADGDDDDQTDIYQGHMDDGRVTRVAFINQIFHNRY